MKKAPLFIAGAVLFFSVQVGSAFADSRLMEKVDSLEGTPYKWAGATESGFDCSGFTRYVFAEFGIDLPHSSAAQAREGTKISRDELRQGDLVFFNTGGNGISHVGIYLGEGQFIHADTDRGVIKSKLSESYYAKRYVTARRVLGDDAYKQVAQE